MPGLGKKGQRLRAALFRFIGACNRSKSKVHQARIKRPAGNVLRHKSFSHKKILRSTADIFCRNISLSAPCIVFNQEELTWHCYLHSHKFYDQSGLRSLPRCMNFNEDDIEEMMSEIPEIQSKAPKAGDQQITRLFALFDEHHCGARKRKRLTRYTS